MRLGSRSHAALALVAAASWLVSPAEGRAMDAAPVAEAPRVVELTVRGEDPVAFEETLRELLARLRVSVIRAPSAATAGASAVLARVQVEHVPPDETTVVVIDGRSGQVLLRRSVERRASAAIAREELAHAAQSAVEAQLLADEDRPAPAPPAPPFAPNASLSADVRPAADASSLHAAARSTIALDVSTVAAVGAFSSASGPVFRIGAGAAIASRRGLRPSLGLSAQLALPFDTSTKLVVSHASLVSARAIPAIEIARASWIAVDLGAGGGVDVLSVAPRSPVLPSSSLGQATTRVDGVFTGLVAGHLPLADNVVLTVAATIDVDLASRRYVLDEGGAPSEVLAPWRVRPTLVAGITFTPAGERRFARQEARP